MADTELDNQNSMDATTKRVRVGVAGAGVFGRHHANKYATSPLANLIGVFDPDSNAAASAADAAGTKVFNSYQSLLDACDAVTIAAPASAHYDLAAPALASGRHVLVEKPIATDLVCADRLIRAAKEKNLVLQVGHQERIVFEAVGLAHREAKLRTIKSVRCGAYTGRGMDVSVTLDLMIHDLDLVHVLTQSEARSVAAQGVQIDGDSADEMHAEIEFENNVRANLYANRMAEGRERVLSLEFDDGCIEIDFIRRTVKNGTTAMIRDAFGRNSGPALTDPLGFSVDRFLGCVLEGGTPPITGEDGRSALALALAIEGAAGAPIPRRRNVRSAGFVGS